MMQFWRIIEGGSRNFLRNAWLSTAATAVMTITLTLIIFSYITNSALTSTVKTVDQKIDISVYLADSITPDQTTTLKKQIQGIDNVSAVKYISQTDALDVYKQEYKNDPIQLRAVQILGSNPFPASFQISVKDTKKLDPIAQFLTQDSIKPLLQSKNAVSYSGDRKKAIDRIASVTTFIKTAGLIGSLAFIVISILIIFNTIRMAIFTRRDEIEIMKLVGATKWFIRGPFIFEASLYGIIAAVISLALSYFVLLAGAPKLASYIDVGSTTHIFTTFPVVIIGAEIIIGILIGTFSSLLAMSRYLKL